MDSRLAKLAIACLICLSMIAAIVLVVERFIES